MRRFDILVTSQDEIDLVTSTLKDGWVPDPVLMPTGRPNIVEGIGAVYHLVLAELEGGADVQLYMQRSSFAAPEKPSPAGEFSDANLTAAYPHGVHPESQEQTKKIEGMEWGIYKVYEKVTVWVRRCASVEAPAQ